MWIFWALAFFRHPQFYSTDLSYKENIELYAFMSGHFWKIWKDLYQVLLGIYSSHCTGCSKKSANQKVTIRERKKTALAMCIKVWRCSLQKYVLLNLIISAYIETLDCFFYKRHFPPSFSEKMEASCRVSKSGVEWESKKVETEVIIGTIK